MRGSCAKCRYERHDMYRPPLRKTRRVKLDIFNWRALTVCGALLSSLGLFGPPTPLWGGAARAWALAVGGLLVFGGLVKGIKLTAARDFEDASPAIWAVSDGGGAPRSDAHGLVGHTGPIVNVDGTPMLDDCIDVAGKVYGDSGPTFKQDLGSGMWAGGAAGNLDFHHVDGNDW